MWRNDETAGKLYVGGLPADARPEEVRFAPSNRS